MYFAGIRSSSKSRRAPKPTTCRPESRIGQTARPWKKSQPDHYSMYFICTTNLVETFRSLFPTEFQYEGNRAINFEAEEAIAEDSVRFCIAAALTHRVNTAKTKNHLPRAASEA